MTTHIADHDTLNFPPHISQAADLAGPNIAFRHAAIAGL